MATLCRTRVCRAALLCVLVLAACPAARGVQLGPDVVAGTPLTQRRASMHAARRLLDESAPASPSPADVQASEAPPPSCPDGSSPAVCEVHPCAATDCGPDAMCEADLCHGCNAVCTPKEQGAPAVTVLHPVQDGSTPEGDMHTAPINDEVHDTPPPVVRERPPTHLWPGAGQQRGGPASPVKAPASQKGVCANGMMPFRCLIDPCRTAFFTPCRRDQVCTTDYCKGCMAVCTPAPKPSAPTVPVKNTTAALNGTALPRLNGTASSGYGTNSTNGASSAGGRDTTNSSAPLCPDGSHPVKCLVDPCRNPQACRAGQECSSNYCGGCNAVCTPAVKRDSTTGAGLKPPVSPAGSCPDGLRPVNCLADPCMTARCAHGCVVDYCGGCNARCRQP